ncbi:hypothetical protein DA456_05075 [Pseudomonas syringae pv. atrofaciens]|uniref:Uncharacterized protein n=1 Tax=Pseudomonas syringae pv. atrofaciens TaxID=192087 RepID=A0AAD0I8K2_PSESX|nr:hypothetical protein [Pseudomonas syringae]AVX22809.1 hypothetical protein DA456_05075 [Pseudomonas syringae pv. atrofaciens]
MPTGKKIITFLVSTAAVFGPLSYLFFALFESARLSYFGAPTEFLQISSFGVLPMVDAIYPALLVTLLLAGLLIGYARLPGSYRYAMAGGVVTYILLVFWYVSLDLRWQWVWGIATMLAAFGTVAINRPLLEIGNEDVGKPAKQLSLTERHTLLMFKGLISCVVILGLVGIWSAVGEKKAATQKLYWVTDKDVILGFYGDLVLTGELNGSKVGPSFKIIELKSVPQALRLSDIGPLSRTPAVAAASVSPTAAAPSDRKSLPSQ